MYHHSFQIVVVSSNDRIEGVLSKITPLEDCDFTVQTMTSSEAEKVDFRTPDAAFIYDGIDGAALPCENQKNGRDGVRNVFVLGSQNSLLADPEAVSAADDIWVMPEDKYENGLIESYFGRLAKRMKDCADARKQGICFDTLINSVPDISWFKDVSGAHLMVNNSFCEMVGKTKEQIYKQGHCYIWDASKEDEQVCLSSDKIVMGSKETSVFEESVRTKKDIRMLKSYKTALIDVNGEIFGTCGMAHDMTELRNMDMELNFVLNSVPFAVLIENMNGVVLNKNIRFDTYFPDYIDIIGTSSREWKESLSKKMLVRDRLMEVIMLKGEEEKILIYEEEPILDIFKRVVGNIVTLMDITMEWSISQKNEYTANTDYLTGLNNRRNLMNHLESVHNKDDLTLVMVDLDNFKQVNDTYGHKAGDKALIKTAEVLQSCFEDQFVARLGGDEFFVVIEGKDQDAIKQYMEYFMTVLQKEYQEHEEFCHVTASIGIVSATAVPAEKRNISSMLKIVDEMLYEAKRKGKDRYCVYREF